ncbi:MAG: cytochrome c biogenesis protein ResB, partial [Actinobacteria bacterium]
FWGSVVLHASIVVIAVGGVCTGLTAFSGELALAEGQSVVDSRGAYYAVTREPAIGSAFTGARIGLSEMSVEYHAGQVVSAVARMHAADQAGRSFEKDVSVNHPLDVAGKSYLLLDTGYAVALSLRSELGTADPMVVNLAAETPAGWHDSVALGAAQAGGGMLVAEMTATPAPLGPGEPMPADALKVRDPRLSVTVTSISPTGGPSSVLWEGVLARGQSAPLPAGSLVFEDLGLWNSYLVRGEPARWITYVGFYLCIIGAAWRFAVPERRLVVLVRRSAEGHELAVSRSARPWSFSERSDAAMVSELLRGVGEECLEDPA